MKRTGLFVVGVLVGAGLAVGAMWFQSRWVSVVTTTADVRLENGIVLPKGTDLTYGGVMSEGFDVLVLHVNASRSDFERLFQRQPDSRGFTIRPYWVSKQ